MGDTAYRMSIDAAYEEAFEELGEADELSGAAAGIYQQLIAGERELSDRQIEVMQIAVNRFLRDNSCAVCGNLELDDLPAFFRSGMCGWHENAVLKDD